MARLMQVLIEKKGWSSMPLTPINKPGGSGAEALVHLKNRANSDPNHPFYGNSEQLLYDASKTA
ncbi:MAG: hypothetical protein Ct9H300mP28_00740 [Pseudomonadota bacterium]|nr:MAG: hypothetical protein Ct9H300mP28_00740 [Pseudomonadota bacterium]